MTSPDALARARRTEPRTASPLKSWLRAIEETARIERAPDRLMGDVIDGWAARTPHQPAILSDEGTLSYTALAERIDRYARWALSIGVAKGDVVALLMPNRPDFLAAWLGITRVGGVVALLNTNLRGASLAHCLAVAGAGHAIVASDLAEVATAALASVEPRPQLWLHGGGQRRSLDDALAALGPDRLAPADRPAVTIDDPALLIYTSGTTGLPKAARVSHRRVLHWGGWFAGLTCATAEDRLYDCLPLYHSVGGCVATGAMFTAGGTVVLAGRFSASRFWDDVARHGCTIVQYIGELCRYLLAAPPSPAERAHGVRLFCGNGLRGDVWEPFQQRFGIGRILEFYAATEGNFSLYNVEGKPGAIGRIPGFLQHRFPAAIVRVDPETGAPIRDETGRCVPVVRGETGEAIGRIGVADEGGGRFEGYTNAAETGRKVLRDVMAPGDAWFRTGDLMRQDEAGFFHFVDRVGDTFRWKGENVATGEVAAALAACPGVVDAAVYGVAVPGADGKAGMAALVARDGFDVATLPGLLAERLPDYARPVFLRVRPALDLTETFKQKKADLVREGFDLAATDDPLFVFEAGAYRPLDPARFAAIAAGTLRL